MLTQVGRDEVDAAEVSNPSSQVGKVPGDLLEDEEVEEARLSDEVCTVAMTTLALTASAADDSTHR